LKFQSFVAYFDVFAFSVWQKLEEQNSEFFQAYYIRLKLKRQIILFNHLLQQQFQLADEYARDAADDGQHSHEDEGREMELQLTPIDPEVADHHSQEPRTTARQPRVHPRPRCPMVLSISDLVINCCL
jgi:hypothetical protein